ncbi:MAG: hypothetical protein A2Y66_06275 [Nitrospirae bacterium RBG_13_41_22]|nr:MAG: hypothetical protein A2Y66_06275 [Nitrospirae bacterium RBG_13_41_22]
MKNPAAETAGCNSYKHFLTCIDKFFYEEYYRNGYEAQVLPKEGWIKRMSVFMHVKENLRNHSRLFLHLSQFDSEMRNLSTFQQQSPIKSRFFRLTILAHFFLPFYVLTL